MPGIRTILIKGNGTSAGEGYLHLAQVEVLTGQGVNIANIGKATQSDTFQNNEAQYGPNKAIDGSLSSFSHTGVNQANAQWMLTFPQVVQARQIVIRNRRDGCQNRLRGARLSVISENGKVLVNVVLSEMADQSFSF